MELMELINKTSDKFSDFKQDWKWGFGGKESVTNYEFEEIWFIFYWRRFTKDKIYFFMILVRVAQDISKISYFLFSIHL